MVSRIMMLAISLLATSLTILLSSSSVMLVQAKSPFAKKDLKNMKETGEMKDGRDKSSVRKKFADRLARKQMERKKKIGDDPRDVGTATKNGFEKKFEKIAEKLNLDGDKFASMKEEVKNHAAERIKLTQKRREILKKYGNDAKNPEAKKELAEVEQGLKEISSRHRELMKDARQSKDEYRRKMALDRARAKRDPAEQKRMFNERKMTGHTERRIAQTKAQMMSLWEEAQKSGFSQDELAAIKSEIDEFIETESEVLTEMSENMPRPGSKKEDRESKKTREERKEAISQRRKLAKKMKDLSDRRKELEKRIRSREL